MGGGAETHLIEMISHLDRKLFEPHVAVLNFKGRLYNRLVNTAESVTLIEKKSKFDFRAVLRLGKLMKRLSPNIIHTYMWTGNLWGRIAALLFKRDAVLLSSERCPDQWKKPYHIAIDRILYSKTDKLIAVADAVKNFYMEKCRIPEEKFHVVRNGKEFPDEIFNKRESFEFFGIENDRIVVTLTGRFSFEKGHKRLLQITDSIIKKCPEVLFFMPGEGVLEKEIKRIIKKSGFEHHFLLPGFIDKKEYIYGASHIIVVPSDYEGISNVLLEAMSRGIPTVSTDVGGNPEIIEDGINGFLFKPNDKGKFDSCLTALIKNKSLRNEISENAQKIFREKFHISKMMNKIESIYKTELKIDNNMEETC